GGVQSVRGYLEAEELGDLGVHTTAQLGSPQLTLFAGHLRTDSFLFYDFGRVNTINALPSEPSEAELRSVGAGFNFTTFNHITGNFTWAYPLAQTTLTRAHSPVYCFLCRALGEIRDENVPDRTKCCPFHTAPSASDKRCRVCSPGSLVPAGRATAGTLRRRLM